MDEKGMIETTEFTFAETKEEALWIEIKKRYEQNLEALKKDMVFIEAVIKLAASKIRNNEKQNKD